MTVEREDRHWVAKTRAQWMAECGLTERELRRAIDTLKAKNLIETRVWRFNGLTPLHIRLCYAEYFAAVSALDKTSIPLWTKCQDGYGPNVMPGLDVLSIPLTENTAESTSEITMAADASLPRGVYPYPLPKYSRERGGNGYEGE
jgi:hypothetical protein